MPVCLHSVRRSIVLSRAEGIGDVPLDETGVVAAFGGGC